MFLEMIETQGKWLEQKYLQRELEIGRHSLEMFAEFLGSSKGYISKVMNNRASPSPETVYQWFLQLQDESIFPAFGIDSDQFQSTPPVRGAT